MVRKVLLSFGVAAAVALASWITYEYQQAKCDSTGRNVLHVMSDLTIRLEKYRLAHAAYPVASTSEQLLNYSEFENDRGWSFYRHLLYRSDGSHYVISFRLNPNVAATRGSFTIEVRDKHLTSWPKCIWRQRLKAFDERVEKGLTGNPDSQSNPPLNLTGAMGAPAG
jgi:hypothetical protein